MTDTNKITIEKLRKREFIVVYDNQIYKTENLCGLIDFKDYYASKSKYVDASMLYRIDISEKTMQSNHYNLTGYQTHDKYDDFLENARIIKEEDVDTVFQEILQAAYDKHRMVTPEVIKQREIYHTGKLLGKLYGYLNGLTSTVYTAVKSGATQIQLSLDHITVNAITDSDRYPLLLNYPNSDGKRRNTKAYLYYLLEEAFNKKAHVDMHEMDEYNWFTMEYMQIIMSIYPRVGVSYKETDSFFPKIIVTLPVNINHQDSLL